MPDDGIVGKVKSLEDMVEYLTAHGMADLAAATQKELDALILKARPAQPPTAKEAAVSLSTATTERTRIITQDASWQEQMLTKQETARKAISKHQEMKEQRLRELEEVHKETMRSLAADYDNFVAVEKE